MMTVFSMTSGLIKSVPLETGKRQLVCEEMFVTTLLSRV